LSEFITGIIYCLSGFRLITRPGIRLYILIPLFINTVLFSIIIYLGISEFSELVLRIEQQWKWLAWIGWLLWPIFFIIMVTLVFFCFAVVANLIAAPFNGLLAEAVEIDLLKQSASMTSGPPVTNMSLTIILRSISSEVRKFSYIMLRTIPLLLLFVIPVVQVLAPFIWIIFAAWVMALEYLEYPLGNHGKEFRQVRTVVASQTKLCMGFGLGVSFLTIIPVINFIAMPVAVSGATKMYLERLEDA
jgi:CysZ protein